MLKTSTKPLSESNVVDRITFQIDLLAMAGVIDSVEKAGALQRCMDRAIKHIGESGGSLTDGLQHVAELLETNVEGNLDMRLH